MRTKTLSIWSINILLAIIAIQPCAAQSAAATAPSNITDTASGWIWDHMASIDPDSTTVSAHAGGPGSSGTYIFEGTGVLVYGPGEDIVQVGNAAHRTGRVRVTVDGVNEGEFADFTRGQAANAAICAVHNLQDGNHSLILEPVDAWGAVSGLSIEHSPVAAAAAAPGNTIANGRYHIVASTTGVVLDYKDNFDGDGAVVQMYTAVGTCNQMWWITRLPNGNYTIFANDKNGTPGESLDCANGSGNDSTPIDLWHYWGGACQQWIIHPIGGGQYSICTAAVNLKGAHDAITGEGCTGASGAVVNLWPWTGAQCQQGWSFTPG